MSERHVEDLLDLYALGTLEPDEVESVERHLEACEACRSRAVEAKRVAALLAWAPEPRTPPPHLGATIRRHIEQLAEQEQSKRTSRPPEWGVKPVPATRITAPSSGGWGIPTPWFRAIAAAGLAVLVLLAGWNVVLQRRLTMLTADVATRQQVETVLRTPGARVITLTPQPAAPEARGNLIIDPEGTSAYLVADGLPALPSDKSYQLWLADGDTRFSAGVFRGDPAGEATVFVRSPKPLGDYSGCGITIEPAGGSPGPTGERVLRAQAYRAEGGW